METGLPFSASIGSFQWQFAAGPQYNLNAVDIMAPTSHEGTPGYFVNLGITFFFNYNAIFDYADGRLAFAPNPYGHAE